MEIPAGTRIDKYVVEALLGRGGAASVFRVRHAQLGTPYALKILDLPAPHVRERLYAEGRLQSGLHHPNVVSVFDVVTWEGSPGLVMELVDGPTLLALVVAEQIPAPARDSLVTGIVRGVRAAHRYGLVHRDLKSSNILLARADDTLVPKIADFGLAKVLTGDEPAPYSTRSGSPLGTPAYMAPEQIRNAKEVDARADVWALGVILYEIATRRLPVPSSDLIELHAAAVARDWPRPRELVPDLPEAQEAAILGCLEADPDKRIPDCDTLLAVWRGQRVWGSDGIHVLERSSVFEVGLLKRAADLARLEIPKQPMQPTSPVRAVTTHPPPPIPAESTASGAAPIRAPDTTVFPSFGSAPTAPPGPISLDSLDSDEPPPRLTGPPTVRLLPITIGHADPSAPTLVFGPVMPPPPAGVRSATVVTDVMGVRSATVVSEVTEAWPRASTEADASNADGESPTNAGRSTSGPWSVESPTAGLRTPPSGAHNGESARNGASPAPNGATAAGSSGVRSGESWIASLRNLEPGAFAAAAPAKLDDEPRKADGSAAMRTSGSHRKPEPPTGNSGGARLPESKSGPRKLDGIDSAQQRKPDPSGGRPPRPAPPDSKGSEGAPPRPADPPEPPARRSRGTAALALGVGVATLVGTVAIGTTAVLLAAVGSVLDPADLAFGGRDEVALMPPISVPAIPAVPAVVGFSDGDAEASEPESAVASEADDGATTESPGSSAARPVRAAGAPQPSAQLGTVLLSGDASSVVLVSGDRRLAPGSVPAGSYDVIATFPSGTVRTPLHLTVVGGRTVRVECVAAFFTCKTL